MFARLSRSIATAACSASATLVPLASSIRLGLFHFGVQSHAAFRTSPEHLQRLWEPNADLLDHGRAGPARQAQVVEDRQQMPLICDPLRISQMDLALVDWPCTRGWRHGGLDGVHAGSILTLSRSSPG